nr:FkbM family methyltransferase [uncultured Oscillibacter sp.]
MKSEKKELLEFIKTERNRSTEFVGQARNYTGDIYLYGAGYHLSFTVQFMQKYGLPIKAILDTNRSGEYYGSPDKGFRNGDEIPIIKFDQFLAERDPMRECWFVIAAPSAEESIRKTIGQHFPQACVFSFEVQLYAVYFGLEDIEAYRTYLLEHKDEILLLYDTLADDKSRETLVSVLKGRLSGELAYFQGCCVPDQYYPSDVIHLSEGEVMVELGSYDGGTLLEFIQRCPGYRAAYCFEPDVKLQPQLKAIEKQQAAQGKQVHVIPKGAWDCSTVLNLSSEGTSKGNTRILDRGELERSYTIETAAVDEVVTEPVSYMKMDIEGAEMRALHGAEKQIRENHPKLAVCVYHKNEDILEIWDYLRKLVPEYRFYLRHHTMAGAETVLYAVPQDKGEA